VPVRIVGATLWTDFEILGAAAVSERMEDAHRWLNDFRMIEIADRLHDEPRAFTLRTSCGYTGKASPISRPSWPNRLTA